MMGLITASGSLARCVGPFSVTYLYDSLGPQITFAIVDAVIGMAIILLTVTYYRLVPYGCQRRMGKKF